MPKQKQPEPLPSKMMMMMTIWKKKRKMMMTKKKKVMDVEIQTVILQFET
jgi:hypothetical protein